MPNPDPVTPPEDAAESEKSAPASAVREGGEGLDALAKKMRENSERWFPALHEDASSGFTDLRVFYALGLAGEGGEVANVVKKLMRRMGAATDEAEYLEAKAMFDRDLGPELADVFTYLLLLADECGVDLLAEYHAKVSVNESRWG
jgi:NTP pyrophosphatase (non-canonical NTP hydrolase)